MNVSKKMVRLVITASIAMGGLVVGVLPGLSSASADQARPSASPAAVTTTTVTKTPGTGKYEVVDGIFSSQTNANARIAALTAAHFTKFTIKVIPLKFAVVRVGLTKTKALALVAAIKVAKIGAPRIKKIG
jgi:cell division septation protein DedD